MIAGDREKSFTEALEKHLKETKDTISGWKNEREFAIKKNDEKYQNHCNVMIQIWENTLKNLEQEKEKIKVF